MVDNLKYLKKIALQDVEGLLEKEKTYKGSWKKSGGRSAWMMAKRKIDRLVTMLSRPELPKDFNPYQEGNTEKLIECFLAEDIFETIKQEEKHSGGKGLDGSVIAEIRDLRRYLLLIESEMYAQGVIDHDPKDDESNHAKIEDILEKEKDLYNKARGYDYQTKSLLDKNPTLW